MPTKPAASSSYEDVLRDRLVEDILASADAIAVGQGPPPDASAPSEKRRAELWGRTDPRVDRGAMLRQLETTGVPPDQLAALVLTKIHGALKPALIDAYAAPVADPALASRLVDLAQYPFRLGLYDSLIGRERVAEAERLDRAWRKLQGGAADETAAPAPVPGAQPMAPQVPPAMAPAPAPPPPPMDASPMAAPSMMGG